MVFVWFSYELWGNRLPNFKTFLKNFNYFAKEVSFVKNFKKNFNHCAKEVSCCFLETFDWISLPAGFQLHDDPVEISISFLWFSTDFRMNCEGIACQPSKHSSWISITLPKRFPSVFLIISIEFRFHQSNFTTILLGFQFISYGFP